MIDFAGGRYRGRPGVFASPSTTCNNDGIARQVPQRRKRHAAVCLRLRPVFGTGARMRLTGRLGPSRGTTSFARTASHSGTNVVLFMCGPIPDCCVVVGMYPIALLFTSGLLWGHAEQNVCDGAPRGRVPAPSDLSRRKDRRQEKPPVVVLNHGPVETCVPQLQMKTKLL
ncbi:hypothetical protein P154DRAFT_223764 [Amniculicola lignicola CBS 123094]|uniref:Uncharacterized protein n=1 Tax=Amniculicola lignicola CBS 123094 TaxID=1392246 RepID=A0A6A5WYX3_9PLEO|nr:hypothetical protein P154DRAFT_223764 [Amniculicola lignicola CBS 123094]